MNKLQSNIINNLRMLSLDMIHEAGSGDVTVSIGCAPLFYTLFMNHINLNRQDSNWLNRDRVIVGNRFLPLLYSTLHLIYKEISIDNLKEYKKLNSNTCGYANIKTAGIEMGSIKDSDVIATSTGIALGEKYLKSLIQIENPKCDLINFHTICICTEDDLLTGLSYESMSFANAENLNHLIFLVIRTGENKDCEIKEIFKDRLGDRFDSINFNYEEIKGHNLSDMDAALEDAFASKKSSIIVIKDIMPKETLSNKYNDSPSLDELNKLRQQYMLDVPFQVKDEYYQEIAKILDKRLAKKIDKWQELKEESLKDLKLKQIITLLEKKKFDINFKPENIKINDNYDEELINSNSKIFNIFAAKSPFILSISNNNFIYTKTNINKSDYMQKDNPVGRNISIGNRISAMSFIANGLASLGLRVFVSSPLICINDLLTGIKVSVINDLPVNYIFTQDSFLNTYENMGLSSINELNYLRTIPNLLTFRPADINEILGTYEILSNYNKTVALIINNERTAKLLGTNYKYVQAGAYRIKRERNELNAILIATGSEVPLALNISEELIKYGIDFRVVTMPSPELFDLQNERYKNMLLPPEIKTFTLEFGDKSIWHKYATNHEYILGIDKYSTGGTKEELLNYYNLNIDSLKAKIIELLKK